MELFEIDGIERWVWMMEYCRKNHINPAEKWAWDKAREEYTKNKNNEANSND